MPPKQNVELTQIDCDQLKQQVEQMEKNPAIEIRNPKTGRLLTKGSAVLTKLLDECLTLTGSAGATSATPATPAKAAPASSAAKASSMAPTRKPRWAADVVSPPPSRARLHRIARGMSDEGASANSTVKVIEENLKIVVNGAEVATSPKFWNWLNSNEIHLKNGEVFNKKTNIGDYLFVYFVVSQPPSDLTEYEANIDVNQKPWNKKMKYTADKSVIYDGEPISVHPIMSIGEIQSGLKNIVAEFEENFIKIAKLAQIKAVTTEEQASNFLNFISVLNEMRELRGFLVEIRDNLGPHKGEGQRCLGPHDIRVAPSA